MSEKLPFITESLDSIPETLHEHYTEEDGSFTLNVAGVSSKKKLDEFRDNNKRLQDELSKLEFVDVDEYKALKTAAEKDSAKGLVQEHDVEELVKGRVGEMREQHQTEVGKLQAELKTASAQLQTLLVDNAVTQAATKHRVKEGAIDDVLLRAKGVFRVEGTDVVGYDTEGNKAYNKTGDALTIDDWINVLEKQAGHLFQESTGAGSVGNKPTFAKPTQKLSGIDLIQQGLQQKR